MNVMFLSIAMGVSGFKQSGMHGWGVMVSECICQFISVGPRLERGPPVLLSSVCCQCHGLSFYDLETCASTQSRCHISASCWVKIDILDRAIYSAFWNVIKQAPLQSTSEVHVVRIIHGGSSWCVEGVSGVWSLCSYTSVCACVCLCVWVPVGRVMGWTRVAVMEHGVASVCLWMTACYFSCADGRCMWRPFGHGSGPVNGRGSGWAKLG